VAHRFVVRAQEKTHVVARAAQRRAIITAHGSATDDGDFHPFWAFFAPGAGNARIQQGAHSVSRRSSTPDASQRDFKTKKAL
jgi:hypothetical protein